MTSGVWIQGYGEGDRITYNAIISACCKATDAAARCRVSESSLSSKAYVDLLNLQNHFLQPLKKRYIGQCDVCCPATCHMG